MKHILLSLIAISAALAINAADNQAAKLEHTFNGHISLHNFPMSNVGSDERYFYESMPTFDEHTGIFSTKTYNEDYSLRSETNIRLRDLPSDYKVHNIACSPYFTLADGSPAILVTMTLKEGTYGDYQFATVLLYNTTTGEKIQNLGYSTWNISPIDLLYNINGKRAFLVYFIDRNSDGAPQYTTRVFSLGDAPQSNINEPAPAPNFALPTAAYDLQGRPVSPQQHPGVIIIRNSDGTTSKTLR